MAFETPTISLHLFISGLQSTQAPLIQDGYIIYSLSGPFRSIGIAFEHERYTIVHRFERNQFGVLVFLYPIPYDFAKPLVYRLVIDGVWCADPSNPLSASDSSTGIRVSYISVPYISSEKYGTYKLVADDGKTVRFLFRAEPGQIVTISGDFDAWDPFLYEMNETEPGLYRLDLPLSVGKHHYIFMYKGERYPDPLNPRREYREDGTPVSVVSIESD
jgi:hypothetical protein